MKPWLDIIGLGEDGLEGLAPGLRRTIDEAELIVGGARHLEMLTHARARTITWATPLSQTVDEILRWRGRSVVVLATGDPMHFGIGVTLARRVGLEEMRIHPGVSAFSLAASLLGWSLSEVECLTLHGRPIRLLAGLVSPGRRLLVLSHDGSTPAAVAGFLTGLGFGQSRMVVLEHMGGSKEARIEGVVNAWEQERVADLNTIAIECVAGPDEKSLPLASGIEDSRFRHDGKITKREVRAATIALLSPRPGQLLWDVGAGSGSIAIEWLRQHVTMRAFAIESRPERVLAIRDNMLSMGIARLNLVEGMAPGAFKDLPQPDAIFLGGGLSDSGLIGAAWAALAPGGRIVANAVTAEGEAALLEARRGLGGAMTRIAVTRLSEVGALHGWKPLMPVTQWSARKP
jgi:precorrin-6Y C5,15-methyltransferase (decarboxylating)